METCGLLDCKNLIASEGVYPYSYNCYNKTSIDLINTPGAKPIVEKLSSYEAYFV